MATENNNESRKSSVEERLKTLYELQTVLNEIRRIRDIRGELPKEVQDLSYTISGLNTRVERFRNEIEAFKSKKAAEQNKIESKKTLIERYKEQLNNVRNKHEFDNLNKEIEYEELEIKLGEKNITEFEREIDNRLRDIQITQEEIESKNQLLQEKQNDLEHIVSETRTEEENLTIRSKELEPLIDERTLTAFKRIRRNARNGLGIVMVDRNACGGCFNRIPPQKQIEIKTHKKIIICEYCGRILIDPDLVHGTTEE